MISIIVPVYNSSQYLHKCIQSILQQTFKDFELLLIDDGSTDNSRAICDDYSRKDSRVRVICKDNGGVSSARNMGLDRAIGELITFVDSDDWVHPDFLKKRYDAIIHEAADVAYCDVELVYASHSEYCRTAILNPEESTQVNAWIKSRTTYSPILLLKKELIDKNELRYIEGLRFGEDFNFILKLLMYSKKVVHVPEALYYYNKQNQSSAMHNLGIYRDDLQLVYSDLIDTFKKQDCYNEYKEMLSWCVLEYKLVSIVNGEHSFQDLKDFYPESHEYVLGNQFLDFKSKLLLLCYVYKIPLVPNVILRIYNILKTFRLTVK